MFYPSITLHFSFFIFFHVYIIYMHDLWSCILLLPQLYFSYLRREIDPIGYVHLDNSDSYKKMHFKTCILVMATCFLTLCCSVRILCSCYFYLQYLLVLRHQYSKIVSKTFFHSHLNSIKYRFCLLPPKCWRIIFVCIFLDTWLE